MTPESLGKVIEVHRKNRGLSRAKLAHKIGRTTHTIGRWERNECAPPPGVRENLRQELGIPVDMMDRLGYQSPAARKFQLRIEGEGYLERTGKSYLKMLREIVELDHNTIGFAKDGPEAEYEGPPEMWAEVFRRYPFCWRNLVRDTEIVGNWHYIPLSREAFEMAKRGEYVEAQTLTYDLETIDFPDEDYLVYFAAFVTKKEYREGEIFLDFFNSIFWLMLEHARNKIFISEIVSYAWTPQSQKLCANRLNMNNIGEVCVAGKKYPIFWGQTTQILKSPKLREHEELKGLYENRYGYEK